MDEILKQIRAQLDEIKQGQDVIRSELKEFRSVNYRKLRISCSQATALGSIISFETFEMI